MTVLTSDDAQQFLRAYTSRHGSDMLVSRASAQPLMTVCCGVPESAMQTATSTASSCTSLRCVPAQSARLALVLGSLFGAELPPLL
jgi:hypothetical protein